MSKGDPTDEQETPTGFTRKIKKPWYQRPEFYVPILCSCIGGGGLFTVFGSHISDAWNVGEEFRELQTNIQNNKASMDSIKAIVWADHENIIRIGDKIGLQLDPPVEEQRIKFNLSTNTP
jgi:hypothetical protein